MLDPNRFALDAATVGFRKRMRQSVNWGNFTEALQVQSESIKVRRELEETPISEVHVMGGQRYGMAGNMKTNEYARQQRQMNGYPLRSFYATGGAIVLPPKHGEGLLATPMNVGLTQYAQYNGVVGNYVSSFTEPLNAPMDSGTVLMARAGVQARSESISNPYKFLQFQLNMHATQEQIKQNEQQHQELRGYNRAGDMKAMMDQENANLAEVNMQRNQQVFHEAGVDHAPGAATHLAGNAPNVHGERGENVNLLEAETGEEVGNFEEGAQEEKKEGVEVPTATQMLRELVDDPDERDYLIQMMRAPGGDILRQELQNAEDDEDRRDIFYHVRDANRRNLSPEQAAHIYGQQGRRAMMGEQLNRGREDYGAPAAQGSPQVTEMERVAGPPITQASVLADAGGSSLLNRLKGLNKYTPGKTPVTPMRLATDGLMPVEQLVIQQAIADNAITHGANALEFNEGELKSDPDLSAAANTAFMLHNMNSSPGFGLSGTPGSRRLSSGTDAAADTPPFVLNNLGQPVRIAREKEESPITRTRLFSSFGLL